MKSVAFALLLLCMTGGSVAAHERPNVLVILCDDLGYGDLACYGNKTIKTPNLDELASEGMRFTDCYSASPLCSPARAGLMTGRNPTRSGIYSWIAAGNPMYLKKDETTIASVLKKVGYDTCHVGKWHLNGKFNQPEQTQPGDHGFDHWFATQNNAAPTHRDPKNFVRNGESVGPQEGFSCQLVVDEAMHWLNGREADEDPFFMFCCFHEPHEPVDSPNELVAEYPDAKKKGEALYYANVANMDRAVGRLMKYLDDKDLTEDTFVFFTSDNGPETLNRYGGAWRSHGSPGPLRGMKLHIYDGGIRVAGIARWPGHVPAKSTCSEPIGSVDLMPTICDLADAPVPQSKRLDGTNIRPLFSGDTLQRDKPLFWHYYGGLGNRQFAMRDGDWKVVGMWDGPAEWGGGGSLRKGVVPQLRASRLKEFELYNIANDIDESEELSAKHPDRIAKMSQQAAQLYKEIIDEGPVWFDDLE